MKSQILHPDNSNQKACRNSQCTRIPHWRRPPRDLPFLFWDVSRRGPVFLSTSTYSSSVSQRSPSESVAREARTVSWSTYMRLSISSGRWGRKEREWHRGIFRQWNGLSPRSLPLSLSQSIPGTTSKRSEGWRKGTNRTESLEKEACYRNCFCSFSFPHRISTILSQFLWVNQPFDSSIFHSFIPLLFLPFNRL